MMKPLPIRLVIAAAIAAFALAGCAITPPTNVHQPISARPMVQPAAAEARGARNVGDTLIIAINEKTNASKKSNSNASRTGSNSFSAPTISGLPGKSFQNSTLAASSANTFDGKGESASNNDFTGTITVTVMEVLANGNLLVSGEKQVGINQGSEFIRFSGVVNPTTIVNNNTVSSVQVADARLEYSANGYIDEAPRTGWLSRFFLSFLPF